MCELQDSCQTEQCLLNTYSEEMRIGLVQQGEEKPSSLLAESSWLDQMLIFPGRLEVTAILSPSLSPSASRCLDNMSVWSPYAVFPHCILSQRVGAHARCLNAKWLLYSFCSAIALLNSSTSPAVRGYNCT